MAKFKEDIAEEVIDLKAKKAIGASFFLSTTVTSSGIADGLTAITQVSAEGKLLVEDVIIRTDSTGIAGGTTLKIICNNAKGTSVIMSVPVSRIGASATMDLDSARLRELSDSDTKLALFEQDGANNRTVLETGKRLELWGEGTFTGAGKADILIKFRRIAEYADVKLA